MKGNGRRPASANQRWWVITLPLTILFLAALTTVSARAEDPAPRRFQLKVEHGKLVEGPEVIRVTEGDRVELRWSSDRPLELHLHGYDLTLEVTPYLPATLAFEAMATGRFPISLHGDDGHGEEQTGSLLGGGHGALVHLEILPR
jgi:hypothetical protein